LRPVEAADKGEALIGGAAALAVAQQGDLSFQAFAEKHIAIGRRQKTPRILQTIGENADPESGWSLGLGPRRAGDVGVVVGHARRGIRLGQIRRLDQEMLARTVGGEGRGRQQ